MNNFMQIYLKTYVKQENSLKDKFLKLIQEEIDNTDTRLLKKLKLQLKFSLQRKLHVQVASLVNSTKYLRRKIILILHKCIQKFEDKKILFNSSYEDGITLMPKPDKSESKNKKERKIERATLGAHCISSNSRARMLECFLRNKCGHLRIASLVLF